MTQTLVEIIASGSLLALVSFGLALVYRSSRVLHMAHGSVYLVGGYVGVLMLNQMGGLPLVAALVAILAAAALGMAIELFVYIPLRKRGSPPDVLFLASLGIVSAVYGLIGIFVGSDLLLAKPSVGEVVLEVGDARISFWRVGSTLAAIITLALSYALVVFGPLGIRIRAIVADADLARAVGIRTNLVRVLSTAIGSALAGLSAFLVGTDAALSPHSGLRVLLLAFTAMIVGGTSRLHGPIIGGFVVAALQQLTARYWGPAWQDGVVFAVLLLLLLARPFGVVGARQ